MKFTNAPQAAGVCAGCGVWHVNYRHGGAILLSTGQPICHPCALRLIGVTAGRLAELVDQAQVRS